MDTQQEVKANLDELKSTMHQANEVMIRESIKEGMDSLDKKQVERMTDHEATLIEKDNLHRTAKEATDKIIEKMKEEMDQLKAAINRGDIGAGAGGESPEAAIYKSHRNQLDKYIRKGDSFGSTEEMNENLADIISKNYVDSDEKNTQIVLKNEFLKELSFGNAKGYAFFSPFDQLKTFTQVGSQPDGGYWVQTERLAQLITRTFETSPMRQIASVISTASESVDMIIDDNEAEFGGWVGETQARPETDTAQISKLTITTHENFAQPKTTQKFLDDASIDVSGWLLEKTMDILTRRENTAFVIGDASLKPQGFLNFDPWTTNTTTNGSVQGIYERGKLEQITNVSTTIDSDGLTTLQSSLLEVHQPGAVFVGKRIAWNQIRQLKDGESRPLINFELLKQDTSMILLAKPFFFADDMELPSTGNRPIAYGDFRKGYTIIDRIGMRTIRDELTDKPNVKFYTTKRVGGDVTSYEAIKILKLS